MAKPLRIALKVLGITLASLVGLILALWLVLAIIRGCSYGEYLDVRKTVCTIPDIHSGFVPQGLGYSKETETYIMSGYNGANDTVFYLVKDDVATRVRLKNSDGTDMKGHGGGVTCTKDYVYISNGSALHIFSLAELQAADGPVAAKGKFAVDNRASFCFSDDNYVYVGEFYRPGNYATDESHWYVTPNGETNRAIVSCYPLNESGAIDGEFPQFSISVTDQVQGFAISGDTVIVSRSYGLAPSYMDYHTIVDSGTTIAVSGAEVPLYYIDSATRFKSVTMPSFSEDLVIVDNRVLVTNESACNKYIVGKLFFADKVMSLPIYSKDAN